MVSYAMAKFKLILNMLLATLFTIVVYSATTEKPYPADSSRSDTTYSSSTQQLKSDKIPDRVFQLTELRHLSINGMDCDYGDSANCWMIKKIPAGIRNLKNLTTLRLTLNAISIIPNELTELNKLTLIDLTDNPNMMNIDNLTKLPNLQYLYLYGCGLTKLPDNIGNLKKLKKLGLTGNHLAKTEQTRIKKALPKCEIRL